MNWRELWDSIGKAMRRHGPKPHRAKGTCICGREITKTKDGKRFLPHKCEPKIPQGNRHSPDCECESCAIEDGSILIVNGVRCRYEGNVYTPIINEPATRQDGEIVCDETVADLLTPTKGK